jgi:uncharacterized membrane protein
MAGEKMDDKAAKPAMEAKPATGSASGGGAMSSESKLWAALCWVFPPLVGIIVLVTDKKNDKFVLFHAYQSIATAIGVWVLGFIVSIVTLGFGFLCFPLIFLAFLYFAYKAYQGEKFMLPVVGDFAEKQMNK